MKKTIYISLGSDCSIAYHLQKYGLRSFSFPFDWILSPKIEKCIENDFIDLFDPLHYIEKNSKSFTPLLDEDWNEENENNIKIYHSIYKLTFLHDTFTDLIEKYKRRVDRFYKIMKDPTIHKKLFRMSRDISDLSILFDKKEFVNYKIYYQKMINGRDWKKEEFDWEKWLI
jgi:hypothetical protein